MRRQMEDALSSVLALRLLHPAPFVSALHFPTGRLANVSASLAEFVLHVWRLPIVCFLLLRLTVKLQS